MALLFIDGYDHYTTITDKGYTAVNGGSVSLIAAAARSGAQGLRIANKNASVTKVLPSTYGTLFCGLTFKLTGITTDQKVISFLEGATNHVWISFDSSGRIIITRNGTTIATGTTILTTGVAYYVELRVIVSDTVGLAEVHLNGALEASYYGAGSAGSPTGDTRNGATGVIDRVTIGGGGSGSQNFDVDDLYILDTSGSAPTNTYLGDVRVDTIAPNGNGNSSVLVGSDGNSTDNYLLVDEVPANDDTDYVESSTPGDKDTYAFSNMATVTGTVYGVQVSHWSRKTDAGSRSVVSVARLSGTEVDSAVQTLAGSYQYFTDLREAKPGGGVWTIADVNSAEFGVKVNA